MNDIFFYVFMLIASIAAIIAGFLERRQRN